MGKRARWEKRCIFLYGRLLSVKEKCEMLWLGKCFKERRDKLEIVADILFVAKGGAKKTEIVYKANLNFNRIEHYLPDLEEKGLIGTTADGAYKTTKKGNEFLYDYKKMKEHLIL